MENVFETIAEAVKPTSTPDKMLAAIEMAQRTTSFRTNNIIVVVEERSIRLYSNTGYGTFYDPALAAMFEYAGYNTYVAYDEEKKKCYMRIF
jgi:hypothetical protein